jgi:hypothetical protein
MTIVRVAYIATSKSRAGSAPSLAGSPPVIPTDWTPVHRSDGELVGRLAPDGRPLLLTGAQLAAPDVDAGIELLRWRRLPALDRRWWARLPSPTGCTVRPAWPTPGETGRALLPVGDLLLEQPPPESSDDEAPEDEAPTDVAPEDVAPEFSAA